MAPVKKNNDEKPAALAILLHGTLLHVLLYVNETAWAG